MRFIVPGEPIPQSRPRLNRKTGQVYKNAVSRDYEDSVAWLARATGRKFEKGKPLKLTVDFYCTPKRRQWTADLSNLVKAIEDGLNRSETIDDDVDVVAICAYRWEDSNPRAEVLLEYVCADDSI